MTSWGRLIAVNAILCPNRVGSKQTDYMKGLWSVTLAPCIQFAFDTSITIDRQTVDETFCYPNSWNHQRVGSHLLSLISRNLKLYRHVHCCPNDRDGSIDQQFEESVITVSMTNRMGWIKLGVARTGEWAWQTEYNRTLIINNWWARYDSYRYSTSTFCQIYDKLMIRWY